MGYACTALRNSNNTATGTFSLTTPTLTRLYSLGGRNYVSHNPCGADAPTVGSNSWTFNWQAPSSNLGSITLYVGALATNHNHATSGDYAYTKTITLTPSTTSIDEFAGVISNLNIYPNPASDYLNIRYENLAGGEIKIDLLDIIGKKISTLYTGREAKGEVQKYFDVSRISKGVYWIKISVGEKSTSRKIVII